MKDWIKKIASSPAADSYKRNLVGQALAGFAIVGGTTAPIFYSGAQWVQLSNILWASAVPTAMKYAKKSARGK